MAEPLKSSIGIWAFGPLGTRFLAAGYHPEFANESPLDRARRVSEGLHDLYDGLELHYPGEIDEDDADDVPRPSSPWTSTASVPALTPSPITDAEP